MPTAYFRDPNTGTMVPLLEGTWLTQDNADGRYLRLAGGGMAGGLTVPAPTAGTQMATRRYADLITPVGSISIIHYVADGWLHCNGQAISRTTYADLYAVIGTNYGVGNGSTTFNVPDIQARVPIGYNAGDGLLNGMNRKGGEDRHTLTAAEMPNSTGYIGWHGGGSRTAAYNAGGAFSGSGYIGYYGNPQYAYTGAPSQGRIEFNYGGGGGAHDNKQWYTTMHYMIKY